MEFDDKQRAFRSIKLFDGLSLDEARDLYRVATVVSVSAGQFVMRQGSAGKEVMFLADGQVQVCRADERGKEVTIAVLGPGEFFGEIAMLNSIPRSADVIAVLPCTLLAISQGDFEAHIDRWPGLSSRMLRELGKRIKQSSDQIADLALYDVCYRVERALTRLSEAAELDGQTVQIVNPKPTHKSLASMVGASREVVTRALKSLETQGRITYVDDRVIVATDR